MNTRPRRRRRAERSYKKEPRSRGAEVKEARVGLSRFLRSISSGWRAFKSATTPLVTPYWSHSALRTAASEEGVYQRYLAFASLQLIEPGSGSNNSERESTSGRSTNYGSGDLNRVFRDIGRIFSLLFLLTHPSPVGQPLRGRGSRNMVSSKAKNGFNCVSSGTHRGGRACGMSFAKTRTPPERFDAQKGGVSGTLRASASSELFFCYEGSA
jgi:hypothetical protein